MNSLTRGGRVVGEMVAVGTIRIGGAIGLPAVLRDLGFNPEKVISEAGLPASLFDDPENIVPFAALGHLIRHCIDTTQCAHFGLLAGQKGSLSSLGKIGFLAQNSPDVGSALTSIATYLHHHDRGAVATMCVEGDLTKLGYAIYHPEVECADQIADGALATGCRIMRGLCEPEWNPAEVTFTHRKPAELRPYQQFFRAPVRFDAEENVLLFATDWLSRPVIGAEPELRRLLMKEIEREQADTHREFSDDVRRVLRSTIGSGHYSASHMGNIFGMNERTLNRRLAAEGTTFKKLSDEVYHEVARQLLADSDIPLSQIAAMLDFSEASAFTRAFRRWSGISPADWRAKHARPRADPGSAGKSAC
ncbi:MAG: AraC family transcriptional regulator [Acetobacteraceae bacterium]|nr:AraC family transcriptional regulator [Acetobacteraceae bacterium]